MCIYVCLEEKGIENFVILCVLSIKWSTFISLTVDLLLMIVMKYSVS